MARCVYLVAAMMVNNGSRALENEELTECLGPDCQMWNSSIQDCGMKADNKFTRYEARQ